MQICVKSIGKHYRERRNNLRQHTHSKPYWQCYNMLLKLTTLPCWRVTF